MRDKMKKDPNAVYTFSQNHLSLSIDPRTEEQVHKLQQTMNQSKMYSNKPFSSLIIKTYDERMKLPKKPHEEDIQQLRNNPFHEQKERQKQMTKNTRDMPTHTQGKSQFQKYIKKRQFFSQPEVVPGQKISPVERFKMQLQEKKKRDQEFNKKLKGDPVIRIKKGACSDKATGVDRFKDIRQGSPTKLGIVDVHKKTKQKRPVEDYEVSLYLKEKINNPAFNPLVRVDDATKNLQPEQFNHYQRPEVLTYTTVTKPLRKD